MIRLVFAVQLQQFLIFFQQALFARRRQGAGFFRRRNCFIKPSRLGVGRCQGAHKYRLLVIRQFAGAFGAFNGLSAVADSCIRTGGQQPGQIVQDLRGVGLEAQGFEIMPGGVPEFSRVVRMTAICTWTSGVGWVFKML